MNEENHKKIDKSKSEVVYESLEEKIIDFCLDEGILRQRLPDNDKVKWGYNIEFPPNNPKPRKISILQPAEKKFIVIQLGTQVSKEHLEILKKKDKTPQPQTLLVYFELIKRMLISRNLLFHIDMKNHRFMISDQIYEDGITQDFFYRTIRRVFNAGLLGNLMLIDIIRGNIKPKKFEKSKGNSDGFSNQNIYFS